MSDLLAYLSGMCTGILIGLFTGIHLMRDRKKS